jgi:hypothetical protein
VSSRLVADAVEKAGRVNDAGHARQFRHAVSEFVRVLGTVPDEEADTVSTDEARVLRTLGENVIDAIEARVPDIASAADAQALVSSVYEIRRLLEEVHDWRRHYAIARHV